MRKRMISFRFLFITNYKQMNRTWGHRFTTLLLLLTFSLMGLGQRVCAVDSLRTRMLSTDTLRVIRLGEVVVTATQPDSPGTSSVIGRDAIRHIQAADLSDLTQLLPGVLTRNPNLNAPSTFTIRSATHQNTTNALGTAIVVDGQRMTNNANLQRFSFESVGAPFNSSALSGFDVRQLSPASIESVEVIRGVPSARYGDVTSGMVLVKSRAGVQPLTVALRFAATEKLASVGKGFRLGKGARKSGNTQEGGGTLYLGADYALSAQDPRIPEQDFQRVGVQAAYAQDFGAASLRVNARGYWGQDKAEKGANMIDGEYRKMIDRGISLSAGGRWDVRRPWLTSLEYQAGMTYGVQQNEAVAYYSGTQQTTTYTRLPGEHEGVFLAPNYFSQLSVEGKPLTADASLTANWRHTLYNKVTNHLLLGIEAGTEGNRGAGIEFDPLRPPLEMLEVRTRSYRSLPFAQRYTAFAEERITLRMGDQMRTELQAGVRMDRLRAADVASRTAIDPRVNVRQVLVDNEKCHLSLRLGWGRMHKMPLLAYLYPDHAYTDVNSFTYNDAENGHRLSVKHTFAVDGTANPALRLPVNRKLELGIHIKLAGVTADVVWFSERLRHGFCNALQAEPFAYRRYDYLQDKGARPTLTPDGVMNNGQPIPYTTRSDFATYYRPENGIEQRKQGVEYTLDLGRWQTLRTSLLVSGAWLKVEESNTALSAYHPAVEIGGQAYPYVGLYESLSGIANLRVWEQFNTRFQAITQLPSIGLVASLTLQAVWMDRERRGMESRYDNPVYLVDDAGRLVEGDLATNTEHRKKLNPVFYLDAEGTRHRFTPEMATDPRFADLVRDGGSPTAFQTNSWGAYFLLNLRLTKEIGRHVSVAFCANNLTQSKPKRYTNSTQQYAILNPDLYYGAEVTFRF